MKLSCFSCKKEESREVTYTQGMHQKEAAISKLWCCALSQMPRFIIALTDSALTQCVLLRSGFYCSWLMTSSECSKNGPPQTFTGAFVLLFQGDTISEYCWGLNSLLHLLHAGCLLSLGLLTGSIVNPKLQFYGLFSKDFPTSIQTWRHSARYTYPLLLDQCFGLWAIQEKHHEYKQDI